MTSIPYCVAQCGFAYRDGDPLAELIDQPLFPTTFSGSEPTASSHSCAIQPELPSVSMAPTEHASRKDVREYKEVPLSRVDFTQAIKDAIGFESPIPVAFNELGKVLSSRGKSFRRIKGFSSDGRKPVLLFDPQTLATVGLPASGSPCEIPPGFRAYVINGRWPSFVLDKSQLQFLGLLFFINHYFVRFILIPLLRVSSEKHWCMIPVLEVALKLEPRQSSRRCNPEREDKLIRRTLCFNSVLGRSWLNHVNLNCFSSKRNALNSSSHIECFQSQEQQSKKQRQRAEPRVVRIAEPKTRTSCAFRACGSSWR